MDRKTDRSTAMSGAEAARLRDAMQAAQEHYERLLSDKNAEDGNALAAAETAMSEAHAAYDGYLQRFAGRMDS